MGYPNKHAEIQRTIRTAYGQESPTYEGDYKLRAFQELKIKNQNAQYSCCFSRSSKCKKFSAK